MNSRNTIQEAIEKILTEKGIMSSFSLDTPENIVHGDYATNIAFLLSKVEGVSPKQCADALVPILQSLLSDTVEKIEVADPGFINFFLKGEVIRKENEGRDVATKFSGENVLVEHSSPNLFKPFSIGHLMNNFIGEFTARAMKEGGANVKTMSFPSDYSLGIAKAMYVILRDKKDISYFTNTKKDEVIQYFGEAYVQGVKECSENEDSLNEAKKILDKMYNLSDDEFHLLFVEIRRINESYFKKVLNEIGTVIDVFQYESWAGDRGKKIVKENLNKVFIESEGAIVYIPNEDRKDINTSVFINSQGYPTYEAKDLGLIEIKFKWLGISNFFPDYSYFVTDAEQTQHFKVVLDAASKLGGKWVEWVEKSHHITHGRMLFKGAKMSSRLGGVPLALDVIETVKEEVRERAGEKIAHLSEEERGELEKEIALSALRISVLRSKPGLNINFDPETSLSLEGDSGPYLLYTHARCASLLEKGKEIKLAWGEYEVTSLEKELVHFEKTLEETIEDMAPQKLVTYLFKIAQAFNTYYAQHQILVEGDTNGNAHRLKIVERTKNVLNKGLHVLGIKASERM